MPPPFFPHLLAVNHAARPRLDLRRRSIGAHFCEPVQLQPHCIRNWKASGRTGPVGALGPLGWRESPRATQSAPRGCSMDLAARCVCDTRAGGRPSRSCTRGRTISGGALLPLWLLLTSARHERGCRCAGFLAQRSRRLLLLRCTAGWRSLTDVARCRNCLLRGMKVGFCADRGIGEEWDRGEGGWGSLLLMPASRRLPAQVRRAQSRCRRHWNAWRRRAWGHAQRSWHEAAMARGGHRHAITLYEAAIDMQSHFAAQLHFSEWKLLWAKSAEASRQTAERERAVKAAVQDGQRALVEERAKAHEVAVDMQSVCALNRKLERHIEAQAQSEQRATVQKDRARQREALLAHMNAIERDEEAKTTAQLHAHIAALHHVIAGLAADLQDLEASAQLALEAATSAASIRPCSCHGPRQSVVAIPRGISKGAEPCAAARAHNLRLSPASAINMSPCPSGASDISKGAEPCAAARASNLPASAIKMSPCPSGASDIRWTAVQQAHQKLHEAKMNKPSSPSLMDASIDQSPRYLRFRKLLGYHAGELMLPQNPLATDDKIIYADKSETTRKGPLTSKRRQPLGACTEQHTQTTCSSEHAEFSKRSE